MNIRTLVRASYSTVDAYAPVASVEAALLHSGFAVVLLRGEYVGLLSAEDVMRSPRALVADCLHERATIDADASVADALELMAEEGAVVLPVTSAGDFVGVCVRADLADFLADRSERLEEAVGSFERELDNANRSLVSAAQSQARLEDQQQRLVAAVEQVAQGVVLATASGRIEYTNPAFERITGYAPSELCARPDALWQVLSLGEDEVSEACERLVVGETWSARRTCTHRAGSRYEAETLISPVRGADGAVANLAVLHRDITRALAFERELRRAQKLEALETLVGGIAHDFNNLLGAITGYAELARMSAGASGEVCTCMDHVLHAADRARELVLQVLRFSKPAERGHAPVALASAVEASAVLLRGALPPNVEVVVTGRADPMVLGSAAEIEQVLVNLGTNAAQAMEPRGGRVEIEVTEAHLAGRAGDGEPPLPAGAYAVVSVRDEGSGIAPELVDRLFDPFFTTRKGRGGTGLGLSVVHGIVRDAGGAVTVDSVPGRGSTFTLFLPIATEPTKTTSGPQDAPPGGEEHILVVDDLAPLARATAALLESLGYRAIASGSALAALELWRRASPAFDMVIVDFSMPDLTGLELADALRADAPALPVLFVTGHLDPLMKMPLPGPGRSAVLSKPFNLGQLARAVRRLLDGPQAVQSASG